MSRSTFLAQLWWRFLWFGLLTTALPGRLAAQTTLVKTVRSGGLAREYILYVPAGYRPGTRVPLLLNSHALGSSDGFQVVYGDFRSIADTANFIIAHPRGLPNSSGQLYFNVFDAPAAGGTDDAAFLAALTDTVCAQYSIDTSRIYSTGMSNGGFLSYELACQMSARIAAIASVAGTQNIARLAGCAPRHPLPVLVIHGTADTFIPYNGTATYTSVNTELNYWIRFNGCSPMPTTTALPDLDPTDGCTVTHLAWRGGRNGTSVEHFRVDGGDHTWPGAPVLLGGTTTTNKDINASVEIWRFLRRYRLNQLLQNSPPTANPVPTLSMWPNPADANNAVTLHSSAALRPTDVRLFDALGKLCSISSTSNADNSVLLNTAGIPAGVYIVEVTIDHAKHRRRLIKK